MDKNAQTEFAIHELLAKRWSPRAFTDRELSPKEVGALFEAARWAPSSSNLQPWHYVYALRGEPAFDELASLLKGNNARWAPNASMLLLVATKMSSKYGPNRHAYYDAGQSVAHLTVQATALGLSVHQMGGFDVEAAPERAGLPDGYEPVVMVAVGTRADPDTLPDDLAERERKPRERKPLSEIISHGRF